VEDEVDLLKEIKNDMDNGREKGLDAAFTGSIRSIDDARIYD